VLRVIAVATTSGTQFAINGYMTFDMSYNFGCMIASNTLFDSRVGFGVNLSEENIVKIKCLMVVGCHGNQFWD